jgi:Fic family protein
MDSSVVAMSKQTTSESSLPVRLSGTRWPPTCWPAMRCNLPELSGQLSEVSRALGTLQGRLVDVHGSARERACIDALTEEVIATSGIEGEVLDRERVRSSLVRRMAPGADSAVTDLRVDTLVSVVTETTSRAAMPIALDQLRAWRSALSPARSPTQNSVEGGDGRVSDQAEVSRFLAWANQEVGEPLLLKAGLAHLWVVTLHPFNEGDGRIARAVGDIFLTRADGNPQRFYSLSAQIQRDARRYHDMLERVGKGVLDVTDWMGWFLAALERAFDSAHRSLDRTLSRVRWAQRWACVPMNERQARVIGRMLEGFEVTLTRSRWAVIAECSRDTALRDISELRSRGLLRKLPGGGCVTSYALAD